MGMDYYEQQRQERAAREEQMRLEREMRAKKMRNRIIGASVAGVLLVSGVIGIAASHETIKPGYAGIVYNLNGGMQDGTLGQGWKWIAPWKKITQYPISTEQVTMAKSSAEGKKKYDESFNIPTSDGKTVNVDFDFSYHFDATKLPQTFTMFRGKDADQIEEEYIKPKMKAYIGEVSSTFSVLEIYGDKRTVLNSAVLKHAKESFANAGIDVDTTNFTRIDPDKDTAEAIQKRINAQQALEQVKIEKDKAAIEAEKLKVEAQGVADAALIKAQGDAKANAAMQASITPQLLQKMEMEARIKWGWVTIQGANVVATTPAK